MGTRFGISVRDSLERSLIFFAAATLCLILIFVERSVLKLEGEVLDLIQNVMWGIFAIALGNFVFCAVTYMRTVLLIRSRIKNEIKKLEAFIETSTERLYKAKRLVSRKFTEQNKDATRAFHSASEVLLAISKRKPELERLLRGGSIESLLQANDLMVQPLNLNDNFLFCLLDQREKASELPRSKWDAMMNSFFDTIELQFGSPSDEATEQTKQQSQG